MKAFLCQMSGIPGTGKSSLARHICRMTNAVLLDVDTIKSSVMNSFKNKIDFKFVGKVAYDIVFSLADDNLKLGRNIVIDSPCRYEIILERGMILAEKHNASYKFVECYLKSLAELNRRRTMREILPSQVFNIPINENEFNESMLELKRPSNHEYLLIDTSQEIEKYIGSVMEYLNNPL